MRIVGAGIDLAAARTVGIDRAAGCTVVVDFGLGAQDKAPTIALRHRHSCSGYHRDRFADKLGRFSWVAFKVRIRKALC